MESKYAVPGPEVSYPAQPEPPPYIPQYGAQQQPMQMQQQPIQMQQQYPNPQYVVQQPTIINNMNQNQSVGVPIGQTTVIVQQAEPGYSMAGHYAFSCVVYWCFNCLFGAIAFFIAVSGSGKPAADARRLGKISMILNIVGIVISVVLIGVILGLFYGGLMFASTTSNSIYDNYNNNNNYIDDNIYDG